MSKPSGHNLYRWGVPRRPSAVVVPARARNRLESPARLYVFRASRGFGKTTIASWWVSRNSRTPAAWVTVPESAEPGWVAGAVDEVLVEHGVVEHSRVSAQKQFVLVLDHGELLNGEELASTLRRVLTGIPTLTVFVLMRLRGPIEAIRDVGIPMVEVTPADLRFEPSDVQELALEQDLPMPLSTARDIAFQTQGWPAMVSALVTGMPNELEPNWNEGALFFDRIFDHDYTPEQKRVDLVLSLPGRMSEELALYLLGADYEPGYLSKFGDDGDCPLLPRPVDEEFRSSPFMTVAATKILYREDRVVHARAHADLSSWYLDRHQHREGLWHAVLSKEPALLTDVLRREWSTFVHECPGLMRIAVGHVLSQVGTGDNFWKFLDRVGSEPETLRLSRELLASRALEQVDAIGTAEDPEYAALHNEWGWTQILSGMPTPAVYAFWQSVTFAVPGSPLDSEARVGLSLGLAQLGFSRLSQLWAFSAAPSQEPLEVAVRSLMSMIWAEDIPVVLDRQQEDPQRLAGTLIKFIETLIDRFYPSASEEFISATKAAWLDRDPGRAPRPAPFSLDRWKFETLEALGVHVPLTNAAPAMRDALTDQEVWKHVGHVRHLVISGEYDAVLDISSKEPAEVRLVPRPWLSILLSRTVAAHRLGLRDVATDALHQAVAVAEECSVFSPFHLVATHELRDVAQNVPRLLAMLEGRPGFEESGQRLTPQQLLLLQELVTGDPLRIIAARLFLSPATVKTHVSHIYRELETANRGETILRAQELRLLTTD